MAFDQVLGLASGAINSIIKPFGVPIWQVGADIPCVRPFVGHLNPRDDAARTRPGFCTMGGFDVIPTVLNIDTRPCPD
jgi:hypothetical protein